MEAPAPATTAGDATSEAIVPERLRSCLPRLRWRRGTIGRWGVSEPLLGPEGIESWRASRRCPLGSRWTSVLVDDDLGLVERTDEVFPRRCRPPALPATEPTSVAEALRVEEGLRRVLAELGDVASGRADVAQAHAERGRRERDPLSRDMSNLVGGPPGQLMTVRLLVLPMTDEQLLGCLTTFESGERDATRDAVIAQWHARWRATPYAITAGTTWLHVPAPPRRLGAIADVALRIAHVSPTLRIDGSERYFVRAASHYWPIDWD